jgi:cell division protein FtsL
MTTVATRAPRRSATRPVARPPVRRSATEAVRRSATEAVRRSAPEAVRRPAPARHGTRAGVGVFVAVAVVFVLMSAVLFHVLLAQGQLELDRLDDAIAVQRREYEQLRLETSKLEAPPRIIEAAQYQGLVIPAEAPTYLDVPGASPAKANGAHPSTTLDDWEDVKPNLGDHQP